MAKDFLRDLRPRIFIHSLSFIHAAHSLTHTSWELCVTTEECDDPYFTYVFLDEFRHWREHKQSRPQRWQYTALHSLCVILRDYPLPLWGRPYHTFSKIFLITMQTCTEEKFFTLAITVSMRSQLLQLITCSDGLADTCYCRSVALKVPLRGPLQLMKDFWVALEHFPAYNILCSGLQNRWQDP